MKLQSTRCIPHLNFLAKYRIRDDFGIKVKLNFLPIPAVYSATQRQFSITYSKRLDDNKTDVALAWKQNSKCLEFQNLNSVSCKQIPSAAGYRSTSVSLANQLLEKFQYIGGSLCGKRSGVVLSSTGVDGSQKDSNNSNDAVTNVKRGQQEIKHCPKCQGSIVKPDDDTCNLLSCVDCSAKYCRVCREEISVLHFISPSGCGFWGQFPWTNVMFQLGMMLSAPIGVLILANITYLAYIVGIPVLTGCVLYSRMLANSTFERSVAVSCGVLGTLILTAATAGAAEIVIVLVGVPIALLYVYGLAPLILVWRIIILGKDLKAKSISNQSMPRRTRDTHFKTKPNSGKRK